MAVVSLILSFFEYTVDFQTTSHPFLIGMYFIGLWLTFRRNAIHVPVPRHILALLRPYEVYVLAL